MATAAVSTAPEVIRQIDRASVSQLSARPTLAQLAAQISENVRALNAEEIDLADFDARQRAAWASVERGEQRIVGSACARRYVRVVRYLGASA